MAGGTYYNSGMWPPLYIFIFFLRLLTPKNIAWVYLRKNCLKKVLSFRFIRNLLWSLLFTIMTLCAHYFSCARKVIYRRSRGLDFQNFPGAVPLNPLGGAYSAHPNPPADLLTRFARSIHVASLRQKLRTVFKSLFRTLESETQIWLKQSLKTSNP